jgi:hypothetical protein
LKLTQEYTDVKDIKHKVEHQILLSEDKYKNEQLIEDLFRVLTKQHRHINA